jgi:hypothetical protein
MFVQATVLVWRDCGRAALGNHIQQERQRALLRYEEAAMTTDDDHTLETRLPDIPVSEEEAEIADDCKEDRSGLTPHQTADCAGMDLVKEYDNEEDGGS